MMNDFFNKSAALEEFINRAAAKDREWIVSVSEKGTDPGTACKFIETLLVLSCFQGHIDTIRIVFDKGVDVNAVDSYGLTALMMASWKGNIEIVKMLLEKDAKINTTVDGYTALMFASAKGHSETVKILLENGADANAVDKNGMTALMYADECSLMYADECSYINSKTEENVSQRSPNRIFVTIIDVLTSIEKSKQRIDCFSDIVGKAFESGDNGFYDSNRQKAKEDALNTIMAAGLEGERFLLQYMMKGATISDGYFLLQYYGENANSEWGNKSMIATALGKAKNRNVIEKLREMVLCKGKENQFAVLFQPCVTESLGKLKQFDALEQLVESGMLVPAVLLAKDILRLHSKGADENAVNLRDANGFTLLQDAVAQGDIAMIELLLDDEADVDEVCSYGQNLGKTALYMAVENANPEIIRLLLSYNANPDAADLYGAFPLQRASAMGRLDIVKMLVEHGADKDQKTLTGKTALMWAEQNSHYDIVQYLKAPFSTGWIPANAGHPDWFMSEYVQTNIIQPIKTTWYVDCKVYTLSENDSAAIEAQCPRDTACETVGGEGIPYAIEMSANAIFTHEYGACPDYGYVKFLYRDRIYYANATPTVKLTYDLYNRHDLLCHIAKILVVLLPAINDRKNILIALDGELKQDVNN